MAFNSHPYAKLICTHIDNDPESSTYEQSVTREYAKVSVGNTVVWRKPVYYNNLVGNNRAIKIKDLESQSPGYLDIDAIGRALFFVIFKYTNDVAGSLNLVVDPKDPSSNYLSSENEIIRYEDSVYYECNIQPGYELDSDNSCIDDPTPTSISSGVVNKFIVHNDIVFDIVIRPTVYNLTINADSGVDSYNVTRTPGAIAQLQGITQTSIITLGVDNIYYGDTLVISYNTKSGYQRVTSNNYTISSVTDNISYSIVTEVVTYNLSVSYTTGVGRIVVKRTYRRLPETSSEEVELTSGSGVINYGDDVSVQATASTGYAMDSYTDSYIDIQDDLNVAPTAHLIYGTYTVTAPSECTVTVKRNGVTINEQTTIYYGDVLNVSVSFSDSSWEKTYNYTYNSVIGVELSQDGDVLPIVVSRGSYREYTLAINPDSASISSYSVILIRRWGQTVGEPIYNGDTIYYGDVLGLTYSSNTNYVVGPGYDTTYAEQVECTTFNSNDQFVYNISGTYTDTINLTQCAPSNLELDDEDKITLKVRYGAPSSTPSNYDSTRRVRVDEVAYLPKVSWQHFLDNLPAIASVRVGSASSSNTAEYRNDYGNYVLIPGVNYFIKFSVKTETVRIQIQSDQVSNISPDSSVVPVRLYSSKYRGTNTGVTNYTLPEYEVSSGTYVDLTFCYKDVIKVGYTAITGWTFNKLSVTTASGTTYDAQLNEAITIIPDSNNNYLIQILRNINRYTLTVQNHYALFNSIEINGENQVPDGWVAYAQENKYYNVVYGDYYSKYSSIINSRNDPMYLIENTHENNTQYTITGDTRVATKYNQHLCAPYIEQYLDPEEPILYADLRMGYAGRTYELAYEFIIYSNNNSYGNYYNARITTELRVGNTTYTDLNNVLTSVHSSGSHFNYVGNDIVINSIPSDHKAYLTIKIYLEGKTIFEFYRNPSEEYTKTIELYIYDN